MKEVFEKIRTKITEEKEPIRPITDYVFGSIGLGMVEEKNRTIDEIISIVSEVEAEYATRTNADRIRSMSDGELAHFLTDFKNNFDGSIYEWLKGLSQ